MAKKHSFSYLTNPKAYPSEMRRQLWPLCCGAAIISGFKDVANLSEDELVEQILSTINDNTPDLQVFAGETINPKLTLLTLNQGQTGSKKIMDAIAKAGFVKVFEATPRGGVQSFFARDMSNSLKTAVVVNGKAATAADLGAGPGEAAVA